MKAIHLVTGLGVILISILSYAEDASQVKQFNNLDKDSDGYISIKEAKDQLNMLKSWVEIDKNTNGKLEFSEFSAFEIRNEQEGSSKAKTFVPPENNDDYDLGSAPF